MIAFARFFEIVQMRVEFILLEKRRRVDALQHLPLLVTAPVCASGGKQLEMFDVARVLHVRAATQIDERTVRVRAEMISFADR